MKWHIIKCKHLQGPVRDAVKMHGAGVASISEADLRPVVIKDFQVSLSSRKLGELGQAKLLHHNI